MKDIILSKISKSNRRRKITAEMIQSLVLGRRVSSTICANYLSGTAKKESKIKHVERFYAKGYLDQDSAIDLLFNRLDSGFHLLSLDRTNWEYGKVDINALALYSCSGELSGLLNLELLDNKGGNSNFEDRKRVLEPVIRRLSSNKISGLLCDREFFSFEFVDYLVEHDVPFVIRIKENLGFIQPLIKALKCATKTLRNQNIGCFNGKVIKLDLSAKKLKDEYLLTVSYKVPNPLKLYRRRWAIESFFKSIKTGGFNIEDTNITNKQRLQSLFLLCAIAYLMCSILGIFRHKNVRPIKFKKTLKCYQFSFFRYGLDWITELIFQRFNSLIFNSYDLPALHYVR